MVIESSLLEFSVEETQQILAMIQNLINETNTLNEQVIRINERLDRINDRMDGIYLENPVDLVDNVDSTHALDASDVDSAQNAMELDTAVEFVSDLIVVQDSIELVAAPQLATNDSHPAVQCHTKDTRKQHACVNRLTVLELFAPIASAHSTGYGSQHKVWKPGLCAS